MQKPSIPDTATPGFITTHRHKPTGKLCRLMGAARGKEQLCDFGDAPGPFSWVLLSELQELALNINDPALAQHPVAKANAASWDFRSLHAKNRAAIKAQNYPPALDELHAAQFPSISGWNVNETELEDGSKVYDVVGFQGNDTRVTFNCADEKGAIALAATLNDTKHQHGVNGCVVEFIGDRSPAKLERALTDLVRWAEHRLDPVEATEIMALQFAKALLKV